VFILSLLFFTCCFFSCRQPRQLAASFAKIQGERKPFFCKPAIDLLDKLLTLDPEHRISAADALDSDYFWTDPMPTPKVRSRWFHFCVVFFFYLFSLTGEASCHEILLRVDQEEFESKGWRRSASTEEAQIASMKRNFIT
jgi:serine/threonine protein kinase